MGRRVVLKFLSWRQIITARWRRRRVSDSIATIAAPPPGIPGCNNAGVPAGDENAARILSADSAAP